MHHVKKEVRAYFASMPPKARAALKRIRTAVRSAVPRAEEAFSYRIPAFKLDGRPLIWYAAFKNHCSLFPMSYAVIASFKDELRKYPQSGKGTIQFPQDKPLPAALVKKMVKARLAEKERKR